MIPAQFEYVAAGSAAHAIDLLGQHGDDAKVLAGGHSLLPMMKLRLAAPAVLIDITRASGLAGISLDGDEIVVGATTRHADLASSDIPPEPIETSQWKSRDTGPVLRHRFRFGQTGNFMELQIPLLPSGKPAY